MLGHSEIIQVELAPGDRAGYERLAAVLNQQREQERLSAGRRRWMGAVVVASLALVLCTLFPSAVTGGQAISLALWAACFLATCGWAIAE